jgi:DNA repair photolyase
VYGYWNNPIPVPININEVRKIFYTVFETDKKSKWRSIMEKKIPLRIGCMSDSFMWIDHKHKLSQELLKILKHYRYPYTILTRSDLLAQDDYIALLDKDLCSVQYSMASTNEKLSSIIEAGAPSPARRLAAIKKISDAGFWVTVRINPILPIYPDGYFTNPDFSWDGAVPKFDFSSFEMVDEIAATGCKSIITGFGRFSSYSINQMEKATGINLRQFFDRENVCKSARDWHYSDKEIRYYYEEYKRRCERVGVEKTVCYIGNGESHFWKHQDLWSNKKDCCNIKGKVKGFKSDTRSLKFDERLKFTSQKCSTPVDQSKLHTELGEAMEKTGPVLKNRLEKDDTNKPEVRL